VVVADQEAPVCAIVDSKEPLTFLLGLLPPSSPFDNGFPCLCYS
jgi:hypothetical protein